MVRQGCGGWWWGGKCNYVSTVIGLGEIQSQLDTMLRSEAVAALSCKIWQKVDPILWYKKKGLRLNWVGGYFH